MSAVPEIVKSGCNARRAAALRREAHEIDHRHVSGVDDRERDAVAEYLREQADRLDGSDS